MTPRDQHPHLVEVGAASEQVSKVDLLLLGLLVRQATYGYKVAEELSGPLMEPWVKLGRTSVYYALGRLARKGLVSKHAERHGGKPERAVYSITDAGRRAFFSALRQAFIERDEATDAFDIALYFSNHLERGQLQEGLEERVRGLERLLSRRMEALAGAGGAGEGGLVLVLENREKVLTAQIEYARRLIAGSTASGDPRSAVMAGRLRDSLLQDVLRGLAVGSRTGVLRLTLSGGQLSLALRAGVPIEMAAGGAGGPANLLRQAFTELTGSYEFREGRAEVENAESVAGLQSIILEGTRGVTASELLVRMLPDRTTILDVVSGYEYEIVGLDLTDDERLMLSELDGVRSAVELSRRLEWGFPQVASVAYPLWAVGWVRQTDTAKRDMVTAMVDYLDRWLETMDVFAGREGTRKVCADVSFAAAGAGLPDFLAARADLASVRFALDLERLGEAGRAFADLLKKAAAARLGARFVDEAAESVRQRLGLSHADLLAQFAID